MINLVVSTVYEQGERPAARVDDAAPVPYDSLHCNSDINLDHPPTIVAVAVAVTVIFYVIKCPL